MSVCTAPPPSGCDGRERRGNAARLADLGPGPRLRLGSFGATVLFVDGTARLLSIPLGSITSVWQGTALLLPIGVLGGFIQVAGFTWLQRRVPKAMLGRTMFIFMGMAPLSAAITGWLMHAITLTQLFAESGALLADRVDRLSVRPDAQGNRRALAGRERARGVDVAATIALTRGR